MAGNENLPSGIPAMTKTAAAPQCSKGDDTADFGDFVRNEDEELDLEEVVEPWYNYDIKETSHVFHPICLGEVLNGRYLVGNKMGSGGGSTVWMAHDFQETKDVALKVMASREVLVFPLMGPCLNWVILRDMPMATRMSAARQLLEAVEIYTKLGLYTVYSTDLNERNCMWGMAPLHNLSRSAKYEALGRPPRQIIPLVDLWKQGELVRPVELPENLRTDEFYLSNFGLAMKLGNPIIPKGYPPTDFCFPDPLHKMKPSFACDMLSYMVIFGAIYLRFPPFRSWRYLIKCLGPLPEQWKGLYNHPQQNFYRTWTLF
ncbi:hypothetical protein OAory_01039390 [Aspergillus oryzae]|uniref:Protein kinase domain-containing protein n=4 Tax=Aspergillus subgen. Circumdati TaxID=2720871 RepID=A0A1S9DEI8_ASPOZ|nr:hypothetical protein OAory_01039390 [Aspergillus oryzae]